MVFSVSFVLMVFFGVFIEMRTVIKFAFMAVSVACRSQHLDKVAKGADNIGALPAMVRICRTYTQGGDIPTAFLAAAPHKFPTVQFFHLFFAQVIIIRRILK